MQMLVDTLEEFAKEVRKRKEPLVYPILKFNGRITQELVKYSERKLLQEYLGLKIKGMIKQIVI